MPDKGHFDEASSALARRALLVTLSLAFVGAAAGFIAAHLGIVAGKEFVLVVCSLVFSGSTLITLLFFPFPLSSAATSRWPSPLKSARARNEVWIPSW